MNIAMASVPLTYNNGARSRDRTGTPVFTKRRILSPLCLPISPSGRRSPASLRLRADEGTVMIGWPDNHVLTHLDEQNPRSLRRTGLFRPPCGSCCRLQLLSVLGLSDYSELEAPLAPVVNIH